MIFLNKTKGLVFAFYLSLVFCTLGLQSCIDGSQDTYNCPNPYYFKLTTASKVKLGSYFYNQKIEYQHILGSAIDTQAYFVGDTTSIYAQQLVLPYNNYGCPGNYYQNAHIVLSPTDTNRMEIGIYILQNISPTFYFKFHKFDLSAPASVIPSTLDSSVIISTYQKSLNDTVKIGYSGKYGLQYVKTVNRPEIWRKIN